ncbi:MAG: glycosyltransferase [Gemmatimonadetes bacterium]|nr:glycosyltransferase [Gemmatimonadota bacterium]
MALSEELEGFENKTEVIPFGIDEERWADVPRRPIDAPPRALFIGRLVKFKGVDVLLRALERVPDLRLDIVGVGPDGPRLKTLTQALALADRVRFHGEYPDEDLPRRMAEADFLVLPSVTVDEMFRPGGAGGDGGQPAGHHHRRAHRGAGRSTCRARPGSRCRCTTCARWRRRSTPGPRSVPAGEDGRRRPGAGGEVLHPAAHDRAAPGAVRAGAGVPPARAGPLAQPVRAPDS